jgi:dihydroorotate dehydrogenase
MIYSILRPILFTLDAETAHCLSLRLLGFLPHINVPQDPYMKQDVAGLIFPNPVGLAPGYDKNAEIASKAFGLGFGSVEVGTLTPHPQTGNKKPRLFRIAEDEAVINRLGFNNDGQNIATKRLAKLRLEKLPGPIGINIGANKDSADRIADYAEGVRNMEGLADYLTVNISSPNTPGLRGLQDKAQLDDLLSAVIEACTTKVPIFLKVAPDLDAKAIDDVVAIALKHRLNALIVSNTTISRPDLKSPLGGESGGLSGAPLRELAQQKLVDFRKASGGEIALIGVGGIASGFDAYARIRAGASLVQLYSALVYHGPFLAHRINRDLKILLQRDGFNNLSDAVGVDA